MKKALLTIVLALYVMHFYAQQAYTVYQIPYNPPVSYSSGSQVMGATSDDKYSDILTLPFNFMFYGNSYNQFVVGGNGTVCFDIMLSGGYCPWSFYDQVPSMSLPANSIFGAYHDIDISVTGAIMFDVTGLYPNRIAVINFDHIAQFSCTSLITTQQIVLYETSNIIEVYIENKPVCSSWNSGNAVIGLQSNNPAIGIAAPNRNTGAWTATNEAWRFCLGGAMNDSLSANNFSTDTLVICEGESVFLSYLWNQPLPVGATENWYADGVLFYSGNQPPVQYPVTDVMYTVEYIVPPDTYYDSIYIMVDQPPAIGITGLDSYYCPTALPDTFSWFPAGAIVTGPGVSGNVFDPQLAGNGQIPLDVTVETQIANHYFVSNMPFWFDDFSTDMGWTGYGNGGWERDSTYAGTGCSGGQCPAFDVSGNPDNFIIGTNIGDCYTDLDNTWWLESPSIDCSGKQNVNLLFYSQSSFELCDTAFISVYDGSSWIDIATQTDFLSESYWHQHIISVSAWADGNPDFRVRFGIGPTDASIFNMGWNIDDFSVTADSVIFDSSTCLYTESYIVEVDSSGIMEEICMVSVDPVLQKNMVIWEKTDPNAETYLIYKETTYSGIYNMIGSVSADSAGIFIDTSSVPAQQSARYKISCIDSCGNVSDMGPAHKTIHLNVSPALPQGYSLTWEHYEGFSFDTYIIYRGDSYSNMDSIQSVAYSPGIYTYTDLNPPAGTLYYMIAAVKNTPCNPGSSAKSTRQQYTIACSNVRDNTNNGIWEPETAGISIIPNPSSGKFTVIGNLSAGDVEISLSDMKGKTVHTGVYHSSGRDFRQDFDLRLPAEVYTVKIKSGNKQIIKKLVVQ